MIPRFAISRRSAQRVVLMRVIWSKSKSNAGQSGQSLVETALMVPLVLLLVFNAVNFAYFFFVAIHLASAPAAGAEYSIQGFETPQALTLPSAGPSGTNTSVSYLTYQDMVGLVGTANAQVQVCTQASGVNGSGASLTSVCSQYGTATTFPTPDPDPEAPNFVLNRVDVKYTVTPLIPANLQLFGYNMVLTPSLTFTRQVSMRAM